jgi:hypothetical protein
MSWRRRIISFCERETALIARRDEEALFHARFLVLTVISVVAAAITAALLVWLG